MDGREAGTGPEPGGRPLTRRELRARAAENAGQHTADPTWPDEPTRTEADSWEAAVGWALRGELPAQPPAEPGEPDDVRWDTARLPHQPDGPGAPGHSGPAGPAGIPAGSLDLPADLPDLAALARDLEPARLPDAPADDRRPWADSGLWGELADPPADDVPDEATDEAVDDASDDATRTGAQPRRVSVLGSADDGPRPPGGPGAPWNGWAPVAAPGSRPDPSPETAAERTAERAFPALPADVPAELPAEGFADDLPDDFDDDPDETVDELAGPLGLAVADRAPAPTPPTLDDLIARRPAPADGPAEWGWRGAVRRVTGGLVAPEPGAAERAERQAVACVRRQLDGPRTVVVINPKGGAHKTTAALLIAATFGRLRGGSTLAWDNNETRGTLGWRSSHTGHSRTAVDLLEDLERFADPGSARVGDLDAYVRSQASAQFDVLASDEDASSAASVDGFAFRALHRTLLRFYRLLVVDTGNNMRASNWQAAIEAADQVVVVSTMREDTAQSAAWMLDALRATGHEDVVRRAVTVLSQPAPRIDGELTARLHDHFGRLTRTVLEVPYEPALVSGGPIDVDALSAATRRAWLHVTAAVADGL